MSVFSVWRHPRAELLFPALFKPDTFYFILLYFLLENRFQRRERKRCRWKRSVLALSTSMEMSTSRWLPMICAWWSILLSMSIDSATDSQSGSMRGRRKSVPLDYDPLQIRAHSSLPERFPFGCKSKPLTFPVVSFCVSVQFWMLYSHQEGWNGVFQALTWADSKEKIAVTSPSSEEKALSLWVQSLGIADICCWFSFMVCDPGSARHPGYPNWNGLGKALRVLGELPATSV